MNQINDLHDAAMKLASTAYRWRFTSNKFWQAAYYFREAYQLERQAALLSISRRAPEPTRTVLLRSAASLAMDCGELCEAEHLIALGLQGQPPDEIAEELRELSKIVQEIKAEGE